MIQKTIVKRILTAVLPILVKEGAAYYKKRKSRGKIRIK